MEKKTILVLLLTGLIAIIIAGVLLIPVEPGGQASYDISSAEWLTISFTDALTGEDYTVQRLRNEGRTVIMQTFSVSCPICTAQLVQLSRIQTYIPEEIAVVGLSLDPSVSDDALQEHADVTGFSGIMAASPPSLTSGLVEGWGRDMLVPANAPVIIICPGGDTAYKLRNGLKYADEVMLSVTDSCA